MWGASMQTLTIDWRTVTSERSCQAHGSSRQLTSTWAGLTVRSVKPLKSLPQCPSLPISCAACAFQDEKGGVTLLPALPRPPPIRKESNANAGYCSQRGGSRVCSMTMDFLCSWAWANCPAQNGFEPSGCPRRSRQPAVCGELELRSRCSQGSFEPDTCHRSMDASCMLTITTSPSYRSFTV